jgi:type IV fimbrial biogenesis protein FimT
VIKLKGLGATFKSLGSTLVFDRNSKLKQQGFTLLELMMTVAIAAILFGVAIPGFSDLMANNRLVTTSNELVTSIHYARSEAVRREVPVSVCASEDGQSCSGENNWGSGWVVFTDANGTKGDLDAGDDLIYINQAEEGVGINISAENSYVRFSPLGRAIE